MRIIESEFLELRRKVLDMAELVESQLEICGEVLSTFDKKKAEIIRKKEKKVDKFDIKIDKRCERIIALYQPVANDLRYVFSTMRVNMNLESIGDNINGIARKMLELNAPINSSIIERLEVPRMIDLTKKILSNSIRAFLKEDIELSRAVFQEDDAIDCINRKAFLIVTEEIQNNPNQTADLVQFLLMIKHLEKIADACVGICEEVLFFKEGTIYRHHDHTFEVTEEDNFSSMNL
ncbi:MAG: phosphate signaling complex protein PhoU [Bacteroidia bacterium]|nr:phosphate signaling complex protein PhoU [Bacteroidia bacterium]